MKNTNVVRNYYVLPCCLLLLNVCNSLIAYKADVIVDPYLRTSVIILFVLLGGSVVAFVASPAIEALARSLHRTSRRGGGRLGEIAFLVLLGVGVFFLYYRLNLHGPASLLPAAWRN